MPPVVRALLNHMSPGAQSVTTWAYDPPDGGPRFDGVLESNVVTIHDARPLVNDLSLDVQGFALLAHASAVRNFWDESELREVYFAEAEALACAAAGATSARVFDYTLRRRALHRPSLDGAGGSFAAVREPVGRVHVDYTPTSAPARLRQVLAAAQAEQRLVRRYAIVGLWRPTIAQPLLDAPLAVCDARSLHSGDLVRNRLVYPDRVGETYACRYRSTHRWYWFPRQRRDEVIVFKHFDSAAVEAANPAIAAAVPHSAFDDPDTPACAPPRESIELRAFVFFDD